MRFLSAEIYSAAFFLRANIQKCAGALHKWERILVCRMRERAPITTRRAWKLSGRFSISKKMVFFMGERAHITEISFLLFSTVPVRGIRAPWSLHFFLRRRRKKRSKEGRAPPRSLRPKILGPLPAKAKLAALKQSPLLYGIAPKIFPCGSASVGAGGEMHQFSSVSCILCPFPLISSFLMGVRTHITILTRSKLSADRCGDTAGRFPVL